MFYSGGWQLIEEAIYDDWTAGTPGSVDRIMEYMWGIRYIDDIVMRRQNSNFGNDDPDVTYENNWYHLTDVQFSTFALMDDTAAVIERIWYDPYGKAHHFRESNLNNDNTINVLDQNIMLGKWGTIAPSGYSADSDFNREPGRR